MLTGYSRNSGTPGTSFIPQRGQTPGVFERISASIGQTYSRAGWEETAALPGCVMGGVERAGLAPSWEQSAAEVKIANTPAYRSRIGRSGYFSPTPAGFTVTITCALVQQHWNPRPPSPEMSFATTRSMYSPGSLNVTEVAAFPA